MSTCKLSIILALVIVIALFHLMVQCTDISKELEDAIKKTITDFEDCCQEERGALFDQICYVKNQNTTTGIILHSPMLRYNEILLFCSTHRVLLRPAHWTSKIREGCQPRSIYHTTSNILLVAQYYYCSGEKSQLGQKSHKIVSTSPRITMQ